MRLFVGLDVSLAKTAVRVISEHGKIVTRPESRQRFGSSKADFPLSGKENRNSRTETHRFHFGSQSIRADSTIYLNLENRLFVLAANTMHGMFGRLLIHSETSGQDWYIPLKVSRSPPNVWAAWFLRLPRD